MLDETPLAPLGPAGLVFMASGQGSQKPGMGADLLDIPEVANVFACASDVLGRDVAALVRDASPEELNDTRNAQIAIAALSVGMGSPRRTPSRSSLKGRASWGRRPTRIPAL